MQYTKAESISLKGRHDLNEAWIRDRIKEDPSILGLGDIEVREQERTLPGGGRLDLLLVDPENDKRYEVELMLGATDESHIIRCVEYWDIERNRFPQYDHCAVLVAEDFTTRFLNVISLFNGRLPLIAIKLSALKVGEQLVLQFVRIMNKMERGEESIPPPADRAYWGKRGSKKSLNIADECFEIISKVIPSAVPKYNRQYIGLAIEGLARTFISMDLKREFLSLWVRLADRKTWADRCDAAKLVVLNGGSAEGYLTFRLYPGDVTKHHDLLRDLFAAAYEGVD